MEVGWGGEGGMVGNIGLLASHLSNLTRYYRPQKSYFAEVLFYLNLRDNLSLN